MKHVANVLTVLRVILTLVFSALVLGNFIPLETARPLCAVVFLFAAVTDFLDGHFARTTGTVTDFGKFLDPVADKFLITASFICLSVSGLVTEALHVLLAATSVIIVFRDLSVTSLRMLAASYGVVLAAEWPGKVKTFVQCVTVAWILLGDLIVPFHETVSVCLLVLCIVCTLYSGLCFLPQYLKATRDKKEN